MNDNFKSLHVEVLPLAWEYITKLAALAGKTPETWAGEVLERAAHRGDVAVEQTAVEYHLEQARKVVVNDFVLAEEPSKDAPDLSRGSVLQALMELVHDEPEFIVKDAAAIRAELKGILEALEAAEEYPTDGNAR